MAKTSTELPYIDNTEENEKIKRIMDKFDEFVKFSNELGYELKLFPNADSQLNIYYHNDYPHTILVDKYELFKENRVVHHFSDIFYTELKRVIPKVSKEFSNTMCIVLADAFRHFIKQEDAFIRLPNSRIMSAKKGYKGWTIKVREDGIDHHSIINYLGNMYGNYHPQSGYPVDSGYLLAVREAAEKAGIKDNIYLNDDMIVEMYIAWMYAISDGVAEFKDIHPARMVLGNIFKLKFKDGKEILEYTTYFNED